MAAAAMTMAVRHYLEISCIAELTEDEFASDELASGESASDESASEDPMPFAITECAYCQDFQQPDADWGEPIVGHCEDCWSCDCWHHPPFAITDCASCQQPDAEWSGIAAHCDAAQEPMWPEADLPIVAFMRCLCGKPAALYRFDNVSGNSITLAWIHDAEGSACTFRVPVCVTYH